MSLIDEAREVWDGYWDNMVPRTAKEEVAKEMAPHLFPIVKRRLGDLQVTDPSIEEAMLSEAMKYFEVAARKYDATQGMSHFSYLWQWLKPYTREVVITERLQRQFPFHVTTHLVRNYKRPTVISVRENSPKLASNTDENGEDSRILGEIRSSCAPAGNAAEAVEQLMADVKKLSPRRRHQVLLRLAHVLEGGEAKDAALEMGVSPQAIHQALKELQQCA